jgi:hypothetical protein
MVVLTATGSAWADLSKGLIMAIVYFKAEIYQKVLVFYYLFYSEGYSWRQEKTYDCKGILETVKLYSDYGCFWECKLVVIETAVLQIVGTTNKSKKDITRIRISPSKTY